MSMERRRVSTACQKCRSLKAKCDGQRPTCARCAGYNFTCTWATRKKKDQSSFASESTPSHEQVSPASVSDERLILHRVAETYDTLIQSIRSKLHPSDRAAVDITLETIRGQLPTNIIEQQRLPTTPTQSNGSASTLRKPTYLGRASDIQFFNTVKDFVREEEVAKQPAENETQSYNQTDISELSQVFRGPVKLPTKEVAFHHLGIYFSTIHIAYPFLCEPLVYRRLEKILDGNFQGANDHSWLALLNSLFAIGTYYTSFPRADKSDPDLHSYYFEQALFFSHQTIADCTLTNVWVLLTQCFYYLAVCQTDSCWNALGFAIRMGQSIGLHVSMPHGRYSRKSQILEEELRRRAWYSMYVLDRLLALQLGRPFAIHEEDFSVEMPCKDEIVDAELDTDGETSAEIGSQRENVHTLEEEKSSQRQMRVGDPPSAMDYFSQVIPFSHILGQVIRELYHPTQVEPSPERMLMSTASLDKSLMSWRMNLPRHLRFDLGHTFERSVTFRRQRNMLAVKYHHLRALIHRPFLCLPWLRRNDLPFMDLLKRDYVRIRRAEKICVLEAQETAHLLHSVSDERSLMHDFPWWQMISCLICASSILLVAGAFFEQEDHVNINEVDLIFQSSPQDLLQDADTCLKVFEALSINSTAAQKSKDMLKSLTGRLRQYTEHSSLSQNQQNQNITSMPSINAVQVSAYNESPSLLADEPVLQRYSPTPSSATALPAISNPMDCLPNVENEDPSFNSYIHNQQWPSEMSDTMAWSAQFLYPEYHNGNSASASRH